MDMLIRLGNFLFGVVILGFSVSAVAVDISLELGEGEPLRAQVVMKGPIQKGDYEKFVAFYTTPPKTSKENAQAAALVVGLRMASPVILSSNGGDIDTAIKIADAISTLALTVKVQGQCASACVLLYLAGATRLVDSENASIGIHRPYFDPSFYGQLPVTKAKALYEKSEKVFREKILYFGMPLRIYEKLMATPSNQVYWLNAHEVASIGIWPPYFEEKVIALCGSSYQSGKFSETFMECYRGLQVRARNDGLMQLTSDFSKKPR